MNGEMLRVRPRRVESVTSTTSQESGLSRHSSFAFDEGPEIADASEKDKTKPPASVVTPTIVNPEPDRGRSKSVGGEDQPREMRTVSHSPAGSQGSPSASAETEAGELADHEPQSGDDVQTKKTPAKVTVSDDEIREHLKVRIDRECL